MGDSSDTLQWAVTNGDIEKIEGFANIKDIVNKPFKNGRPPLCIAADYGQLDVIEYLLKNGADINASDKHGITPLLSAIYEGHTKCVDLLLKKGADKNGKAPDGSSYVECAEKGEIKALLN